MIVFSVLSRLVRRPGDSATGEDSRASERTGRFARNPGMRDPVVSREEFERYRASVRQDLEWLLNTRRVPDPPFRIPRPGEEVPPVEESVYCYGLPDFTQMNLSPGKNSLDQDRLSGIILRTIELFEPRMIAVQVSMRSRQAEGSALHFQVSGKLKMDPKPEPVSYDTTLDVLRGEYAVHIPEGQS